jgi:putative selenate reductase
MCNECGNCETFCPHNGAPYKDKITLFKNEQEYNHSTNNGFYVASLNDDLEIISRFNSKHDKLRFSKAGEPLDYVCPTRETNTTNINEDEERTKLMKFLGKIISEYSYLLSQ